ncbi:MAG: Coenzyme F420 hydrogenase/dehydrogenase, beta subunit C-terminal domain [Candidatus Heimdallarchaeaceae archaeon]
MSSSKSSSKAKRINFSTLFKGIIKAGYCASCGACVSVCPVNSIEMQNDLPKLVSACISCGACVDACYRFQKREKQEQAAMDPNEILEIYTAKAKDERIYTQAQNGGVVTTLLVHAFEEGLIDGALVTDKYSNLFEPKPVIVNTSEGVIHGAGSKYVISNSLTKLDAVRTSHKKKAAIVGVPCHIESLTRIMEFGYLGLDHRVALKIGLFCMHSYDKNLLKQFVADKFNITPEQIIKMDIDKGKFIFVTETEKYKVKLSDVDSAFYNGCHFCSDFTAEYSDIAVGNIGVDSKSNVVLIRTQKGKELFESAIEKGLLEVTKIDSSEWETKFGLVFKLEKRKKKEAKPLPALD